MTVEIENQNEAPAPPALTGAPRAPRPDRLALLARRVQATGDGAPIEVRDPFNGEVIGTVPRCRPQDVLSAAARGRAAQPAWAALSFRTRGRVLARFHDLLLRRQHEVLDIIQRENGKTRLQAFEELMGTANAASHYAYAAGRYLRPRRRAGAMPLLTSTLEARRPRGLIGFITPWNYPLTMGLTDALAALAAGNAVLIKPDDKTPFSLLWAVGLLEEAGLPRRGRQRRHRRGPRARPADHRERRLPDVHRQHARRPDAGRRAPASASSSARWSSAARTRCSCSATPTSTARCAVR